jgi:hypothetical protein
MNRGIKKSPITIEKAKQLLADARCPDCLTQIRIKEVDGDFFKNKNYKVFHNGTRVLRCPNTKCKALLFEE